MPTHAACPLGGRAGAAALSAEAPGGGPTPISQTAAADRTSRQAALAGERPPIPTGARQTIPHARSHKSLPARGTSPGRLPHGAAGELSVSEMVPPPVQSTEPERIAVRPAVAHVARPGGGASHHPMTTVYFVRVCVFRMSQTEFAELLGTSQGRVSTWETSGRWPSVVVMDLVRLHGRSICAAGGEVWSDSWFFEVPDGPLAAGLDLAAE